MTDPTIPPQPEDAPDAPVVGEPPAKGGGIVAGVSETVSTEEAVDAAAPSTEPVEIPMEPEPVTVRICQHALNSGGETVIPVPKGTKVLDIHMIDGGACVRTIERTPVEPDTEVRIVCVPLGGELKGHLQHINARASGVHYFVVGNEAPIETPA